MADLGVNESSILDLVVATLPYFEKMKFSAPQKYTTHPILNRQLAKGMKLSSGVTAEKRVVIKPSGRAGFTQLYATKDYAHFDVLQKATAPWAHLTTDWMFDRREILMNREPQRIVDIMKTNRIASESDMANVYEENAWQTVVTEANEYGSFRGLPYWVSKGTSGGYNGKSTVDRSATAITTVGNINGNTAGQEFWANYTQSYTNYIDLWIAGTITGDTFTEDALSILMAMNLAYEYTNFEAPRTVENLDLSDPLSSYVIYCDTKTKVAYNAIARAFNQGAVNFGYDVAYNKGIATFNGTPLYKVPQLDSLAGVVSGETAANAVKASIYGVHPIYFVNHNELETMVLRGNEFFEHKPMILPESGGNVAVINVDLSCQLMCGDRRKQALVFTA